MDHLPLLLIFYWYFSKIKVKYKVFHNTEWKNKREDMGEILVCVNSKIRNIYKID